MRQMIENVKTKAADLTWKQWFDLFSFAICVLLTIALFRSPIHVHLWTPVPYGFSGEVQEPLSTGGTFINAPEATGGDLSYGKPDAK